MINRSFEGFSYIFTGPKDPYFRQNAQWHFPSFVRFGKEGKRIDSALSESRDRKGKYSSWDRLGKEGKCRGPGKGNAKGIQDGNALPAGLWEKLQSIFTCRQECSRREIGETLFLSACRTSRVLWWRGQTNSVFWKIATDLCLLKQEEFRETGKPRSLA